MDISRNWVCHFVLAEMVDTSKSSHIHRRAMENKLTAWLSKVFVQDIEDRQRLDCG